MSKLTDEQKKAYLQNGGNRCPDCRNQDIEGGHISIDPGVAWQPVKCNACYKRWVDIYKLIDVEEEE